MDIVCVIIELLYGLLFSSVKFVYNFAVGLTLDRSELGCFFFFFNLIMMTLVEISDKFFCF